MRVKKDWHKKFFKVSFYNPAGSGAVARAPSEVRFAAKALGLKKSQKLLDLCCGPGRHSVLFAKKGAQVTGFDFSEDYLKLARASAKRAGVKINFVKGDMRKLSFNGEFDAAINLFTSFGYFHNPADDIKTLKGVSRALKPGGRFLMEMIDGQWVYANFRRRIWQETDDGFLLEENELDKKKHINQSRWIFIAPGKKPQEGKMSLRLYNRKTLSAGLRKAGLKPLKFWNGYPGSRIKNRLIALAEKPGGKSHG